MRTPVLLGIVLLGLGGYILVRGINYTSDKAVLKVGEFHATMEQKRSIPPWVGGVAVAAGVVMIMSGRRPRP
jgi:hypothetical protein